METVTFVKCAKIADQFSVFYADALALPWRTLQQAAQEFGQIALEEPEPHGENPTAEEKRLWETALILAAYEHSLILRREGYGSRLIFSSRTARYNDPFADE